MKLIRPDPGNENAPEAGCNPSGAITSEAPDMNSDRNTTVPEEAGDGLLLNALELAADGVKIFPCHRVVDGLCTCTDPYTCKSPGKHPRTKNGSKDATSDPGQIKAWWTMWGAAGRLNFGQTLQGRAVVDVDVAGGKPGMAVWAALSAPHGEPETLTYRTGRSGLQMVFRLPAGEVGGMENGYGNGLAEAVDFKTGPGSYVMVPGSKTEGIYTVVVKATAAALPQWIATVARSTARSTITRADGSKVVIGGFNFKGMTLTELEAIPSDDPRRGNNWLTALAGHAAHLHPDKPDVARMICKLINDKSADPIGAHDFDKTMHSVLTREAAQQAEAGSVVLAGSDETAVQALLDRLIDSAGLDDIEDPVPLIDGWLTLDTLARVNGEPASAKSLVTLDWAGCVGTGIPWRGHEVRQGQVVYIVAEGVKGFKKRVRAWEQRYDRKMTGVLFLPEPLQVNGPEWDTYTEVCKRLGAVFIVLDTQRRVTVGVDENSNTEFGSVVDRLENLRGVTGACVELVHHTPKGGVGGSGAGAVTGAVNSEFLMTKRREKGQTLYTLENIKEKDEAEGGKKVFTLEVHEVGVKENGDPLTSVTLVDEDMPEDRLPPVIPGLSEDMPQSRADVLEVIGTVWEKADDFLKSEIKAIAVPKMMSDATFKRAWNELAHHGVIAPVVSDTGKESTTRFELRKRPQKPSEGGQLTLGT